MDPISNPLRYPRWITLPGGNQIIVPNHVQHSEMTGQKYDRDANLIEPSELPQPEPVPEPVVITEPVGDDEAALTELLTSAKKRSKKEK